MTTFPQVNFGLWWLLILFVCFTKLPAVELLSFDDNLQTSTDLIVEDLVHKYIESHEFWETFSHGTGEDSREGIVLFLALYGIRLFNCSQFILLLF